MLAKSSFSMYLLWTIAFILVPFLVIFATSFVSNTHAGFLTLDNYKQIFQPLYLLILVRSFFYGFLTTLFTLVVGFSCAFALVHMKGSYRNIILFVLILPVWINMLLRTYAWMAILGSNSLFNNFLVHIGLPKINILYTPMAILLGMMYNFLPYMIMPIYTQLRKVDPAIIEAANDLGASRWKIFTRIWLPLTWPGMFTGIILVFIPSITYTAISDLLGGMKYMLVGNLISSQAMLANNWAFASAISFFLITIVLVVVVFMERTERSERPQLPKAALPRSRP